MKGFQYSVRVYEVSIVSKEDEDKFINIIEKNYPLLKNRLIIINGAVSQKLQNILESKKLTYTQNLYLENIKNKKDLQEQKSGLKIVDKLVRSGQEIDFNGDILLLNKVNSGAVIKNSGNLIAVKEINGNIECNGDFMLIKATNSSNVIFNGVDINENLPKDRFCKIEFINGDIIITPMKKEFNWVS